jgi:hypothetical protein
MEECRGVIELRGSLKAVLKDLEGNVILERENKNLVVSAGRSWVLGQLETVNQNTALAINYIAIGSVTTAPVSTDTALGGEVTRVAVGTWVTTSLTVAPPSWQAQVSFATNQANTTLAECGLFNSSAAGTMLAHATFASFIKATSNTLNISYTISD